MAMPISEIKKWLETLNEDDMVGVDDDGLSLSVAFDPNIYLEIGGVPFVGAPENMTKEGILVEAGQVWRDLDKRCSARKITITEVKGGFAYYDKPRKGRISIQRMHQHSTGYALVKEE